MVHHHHAVARDADVELERMRAEARPIHKGRRTHVWETRITDEAGRLLSVTTQTQIVL